MISLFASLNALVISLNFPGACMCVVCNPLGLILCLHAKNDFPKRAAFPTQALARVFKKQRYIRI